MLRWQRRAHLWLWMIAALVVATAVAELALHSTNAAAG